MHFSEIWLSSFINFENYYTNEKDIEHEILLKSINFNCKDYSGWKIFPGKFGLSTLKFIAYFVSVCGSSE
jgi:hypothetical protein